MDNNTNGALNVDQEVLKEAELRYHEVVTVSKTSGNSVTSGSTGSTIGCAYYSASCTAGTMTATVQYYDSSDHTYHNSLATKTIKAGESFNNRVANEAGRNLFRLVLSGSTGRGSGTIQGYN